MKKTYLLLVISAAIISCNPYEKFAYFDVPLKKVPITLQEAQEDLNHFQYLIENAYAGYEQLSRQIDFPRRVHEARENLLNDSQTKKELTVFEFQKILLTCLQGIQDAHLALITGRLYSPVCPHQDFQFTSILLEKKEDRFFVHESSLPEILPGMEYQGPSGNLYPMMAKSGTFWILGFLGPPKASLKVKLNSAEYELPLINNPSYFQSGGLESNTSGTIGYISLRTLSTMPESEHDLYRFVELGEKYRNLKTLILDFRGNRGGSDAYWRRFIQSLYDLPKSENLFSGKRLDLISPPTLAALLNDQESDAQKLMDIYFKSGSNVKTWYGQEINTRTISPGPKGFKGRLFYLMDRNTGSSAESIVPPLRVIPGATIIGENSAGANNFGNIISYSLPKSGIKLILARSIFKDYWTKDIPDGYGYRPDFWIRYRDDLLDTISALTGDPVSILESLIK